MFLCFFNASTTIKMTFAIAKANHGVDLPGNYH